jgi:hypothetical protein
MERPQRVRPAGSPQLRVGRAGRRLQQRVVFVRSRRVDVEVGRHHVVVASQDDGDFLIQKVGSVIQQPMEPVQFVVKFRTRLRIAVGQL